MFLSPIERMISWRYLRAKRKEGFVSVITLFSLLGIGLGVASLIVILSVMNGVKSEMLSRFIGVSGHVEIYGPGRELPRYDEVMESLQGIEGIQSVAVKVEGQVMVSANGVARGAQVTGFRYEDILKKPLFTEHITQGSIDDFASGEGIIIGVRLAENMGLELGDMLTLISPEGRQTIAGVVPRLKAYPIVAMFDFGMYALDSGLVVMPFEEAQVYFKLKDAVKNNASGIEVVATHVDDALAVAARIRERLKGEPYRVQDWQQTNASVFGALEVQRTAMFLILTLIIIVAAFNIISSLIMLVKDKGQAIGILRTIGASRGMIMRVFFACGALIGIMGTGFGLVLGLVLAANVDRIRQWIENATGNPLLSEQLYFLSHLPTKTEPSEVMAVVLMSLTLSFLATLYPAWRASSLNPAEALRYE